MLVQEDEGKHLIWAVKDTAISKRIWIVKSFQFSGDKKSEGKVIFFYKSLLNLWNKPQLEMSIGKVFLSLLLQYLVQSKSVRTKTKESQ